MTKVANKLTLEQAQREVSLLQGYAKALQAENSTRNEERKILEKQIQRLSSLQKSKIGANVGLVQSCEKCEKLKGEVGRLEKQVGKLEGERREKDAASGQLERKYRELSVKYEEMGYENRELKKGREEASGKRDTLVMEQKVKKLEMENSGLNSKVASLELEIKSMKLSIKTKDNEVAELKSRVLVASQKEIELRELRQSYESKDKELSTFRQSASNVGSLQFQLRSTKALVASKEGEITKLKESVLKNQQQVLKSYQLQSQIRSMKYIITTKDSQIEVLKNKTKEISASEYSRITGLENEVKNLKCEVSGRNSEIAGLRNRVTEMGNERGELQLRLTEREKKMKEESYEENREQVGMLNAEIGKLTSQIKQKDGYIIKIEYEIKKLIKSDEEKNLQVIKLDNIVNGYVEKIGQLEIELNKLEKNSGSHLVRNYQSAMVVGNQQIMLFEENKILNEKITDLERRILILEQTNINLREELKLAIEGRNKDSSRLMISPSAPIPSIGNHPQFQSQFLSTIKMLTIQNQGIKQLNSQLKSDNEYLQARLSSSELKLQKLSNSNHDIVGRFGSNTSSKGIVNMPPIPGERNRGTYEKLSMNENNRRNSKQIKAQHTYTILDDNQRDPLISIKIQQPSTKQKLKSRNEGKSKMKMRRGTSESQLKKDQSLKLVQVTEKQEKRRKGDRTTVEITNIGGGNVGSGSQFLTQSKGNPELGKDNQQRSHRLHQFSQRYSTLRNTAQDELQRKIEMLREENKGLRKHLYQVNS